MIKELSKGSFKFFLSGHGMSVKTGKYVMLAVLVGGLVGLVTVAFEWMIAASERFVFPFLLSCRPLRLVLPAAGAVAGCLLIRRFARVEHARGTDSAVRAFHRGESISRGVIPVKSVASVLTVGCGGSAGYEGPVTLLGAACGSVVTRWFSLDKRAARILMAAGLAAGISALFRAPFAGAIFGSEIFYSSSDFEADTLMPSVVASVVSYTIFSCFFGWTPLFEMPPCAFENGFRLLPYFVLALVAALGARFYISVFRWTERWFSQRTWPMWSRVALGGVLTGGIGFFVPDVLGPGYELIRRSLATGTADALAGLDATTAWAFLGFFFIKTLATACTVGSGGSGGVFAPALVCGGLLGAATGIFFLRVLPPSMGINPAAFTLVGMAAFLASAIRVPLTAIVMVAELSDNHRLLLPTMWACCLAFWLNNGWSLYRSQVHGRESSPLH
jgi:CIC family chloride channel protein